MNVITRPLYMAAVALAALLTAAAPVWAQGAPPKIDGDDIGGVVRGPTGPEAGVWVIAETTDLGVKRFTKIVVTDDQGRYVIPDLPKAKYDVWVRGYGLVDSAKTPSVPGKIVNLTAVKAPDEKAAARYYPGMYWYSMLKIPPTSDFPGTGDKGNGIPPYMKAQAYWIDTVKNSCQSCHALGSERIRNGPTGLGEFSNSTDAWARRIQSGQAMSNMALTIERLGPEKGLSLFADWTDRVAKGELPAAKPPRPQGVERNVVISEWTWATPTHYLHDEISTDKRNPRINANGLIYGSPEESTDEVPVLDPVHFKATTITEPYLDPKTPSSKDNPMGPSFFWGDGPIWDSHTSIHNPIMDEKGRVWFTAKLRPNQNPAWCQTGSDQPSAKVTPLKESARQLSMYDPKTKKWSMINTCFSTHHLYFTKNEMLWTSAGGPQSGVVGWLDVKKYLATHDEKASQGWSAIVVDTNGNGKRDDQDKKVQAAFYAVQPSTVDDSIWGQSMDVGFSRMDQPGYIMRLVPGKNPPATTLTEIYLPPDGTFGPRGVDIDSHGVVWTGLASGQLASFDRSKCKGPLNGPDAATGKLCREGWTLYRMPGPQFAGVDPSGSADHAYYVWVDRFNTLGLGPDVPIMMANGSESMLALVNGKFVDLHVPYPMGLFTKNADGRIDDPKAGWKGRGLWTTSGTRTVFHNEGGKDEQPLVYKFQIRPNPLAN
jgi:hypothetical protein